MSELAISRGISLQRIGAMILRYWYLLLSSWPRLLELMYWPILQVITWGFLQSYIAQNAGFFARAGGTLIGAVILWDILFRGQLGFSVSFLEEMWARNLGNLMMSPLKPIEFLLALMVMSLIRLALGVIPMTLLALYVFDFNFYGLGLPAIAFFCNLIFTSWAVGIFVSGLVLRNGLGAESIVWTLMFALLPLACVYYLPRECAAAVAAARRLVRAADLCVRRPARAAHRSRLPRRSDAVGARHQRGAAGGFICIIHCPFEQRPPSRLPARRRRIGQFPVDLRAVRSNSSVDIAICALTRCYAFVTMLRRKTGV